MRMIGLIITLCVCIQCKAQNTNKIFVEALLIPNQTEIPVYLNENDSKIQFYIMNDTVKEDYCTLKIKDSRNGLFKVEAAASLPDSLGNYPIAKEGWIESKYVGIYFRENILREYPLYTKPNIKSKHVKIIYNDNSLLPILNVYNGWIKTSFEIDGKCIIGWVPSNFQCANPYTTCN